MNVSTSALICSSLNPTPSSSYNIKTAKQYVSMSMCLELCIYYTNALTLLVNKISRKSRYFLPLVGFIGSPFIICSSRTAFLSLITCECCVIRIVISFTRSPSLSGHEQLCMLLKIFFQMVTGKTKSLIDEV